MHSEVQTGSLSRRTVRQDEHVGRLTLAAWDRIIAVTGIAPAPDVFVLADVVGDALANIEVNRAMASVPTYKAALDFQTKARAAALAWQQLADDRASGMTEAQKAAQKLQATALLQYAEANLRRAELLRGKHDCEHDYGKAWFNGAVAELAEAFAVVFGRRAGYSNRMADAEGPFVSFATQILLEAGIRNRNKEPYARTAVVKALKENRRANS
ncbi:hypothetical protein SLNSH_22785 [Alsobacter soli]|uniref:Uncharacterized protein n=1 Tax=Alsobacter soli TaxID=2109933 RepID=A0A2T1HM08_9HYPH|nr:hypothetical protein [Alsobacter soli]PSC02690.1 hypothetical protein SLNSH_22785 [Alsobacter soli]